MGSHRFARGCRCPLRPAGFVPISIRENAHHFVNACQIKSRLLQFKWPVHLPPLERASGTTLARDTVRPPTVELTEEQFLWLLDGLDLRHLKPHRALEYRSVL